MSILLTILELISGVSGAVEPIAKFLQWLSPNSKKNYEMNIVRFNEYLYKHFGSYFFTVCTTENRYLDVKSRNDRIGLNSIFESLSRSSGPRVILLWAEGGMGKTTLASHIVRTAYLREKWFNVLIGGSAKQQALIDGEVKTYNDAVLTYTSLLDLMGEQFGVSNIRKVDSIDEKLKFLQRKLRDQKTLLLIDNMETLSNTEEIVDGLTKLVANTRNSRVLITTRDGRLKGRDLLPVYLSPLTLEEGLQFANWYVNIRGFDKHSAVNFTTDVLRKVVTLTGGSPLAIEQVISQTAIIGMSTIESMRKLSGDWYQFYDFLFSHTFDTQVINSGAKKILWHIATLHRPSTYDDIREFAKQSAILDELDSTIKTLVGLDLLKSGMLLPDSKNIYRSHEEKPITTLYSVSPMLTNYVLRNRAKFTRG